MLYHSRSKRRCATAATFFSGDTWHTQVRGICLTNAQLIHNVAFSLVERFLPFNLIRNRVLFFSCRWKGMLGIWQSFPEARETEAWYICRNVPLTCLRDAINPIAFVSRWDHIFSHVCVSCSSYPDCTAHRHIYLTWQFSLCGSDDARNRNSVSRYPEFLVVWPKIRWDTNKKKEKGNGSFSSSPPFCSCHRCLRRCGKIRIQKWE